MRADGDGDAALLRGGVVVEDAAVVVGVLLGKHVDAQEGHLGVLAVARALGLPVEGSLDKFVGFGLGFGRILADFSRIKLHIWANLMKSVINHNSNEINLSNESIPVVPGVDDADEVVERLHLDGHDAGAAGRRHDGAEHGGGGVAATAEGDAVVSGVGGADRRGCLWFQRTGVGDRWGVERRFGGALRCGKL